MILLPSRRIRVARVPFLFRASDCVDESGIFALSYGKRVAGVMSRPSRKRLVDQNGRQFISPVGGVPLGRFAGEMAGLFEGAGKNLALHSQALDNPAWAKQNGATVTPNAAVAPDGTTTMDLVVGSATTGGEGIYQTVSFTGDGEKCVSWFLREGTGDTRVVISIYDLTATTHRHQVRVTWTAGIPALATLSGSGTLFPVEWHYNGGWRVAFSAPGVVAANTNRIYLYTAGSSTAFGTVYAWGAQPEDAAVPSSYIPTTTLTVTRAADSLYFDLPGLNPPRVMTLYQRSVNVGQYAVTGATYWMLRVGSAAVSTDPRIGLFSSASGQEGVQYDDGVTLVSSAGAGATQVLGDVAEHLGVFSGTTVRRGLSMNGGAENMAAESVATGVSVAWSAARIYFTDGATNIAYTHALIAEGGQARDTLRELAGVG